MTGTTSPKLGIGAEDAATTSGIAIRGTGRTSVGIGLSCRNIDKVIVLSHRSPRTAEDRCLPGFMVS